LEIDKLEALMATSEPGVRNGNYVDAGGLNTYYEVSGEGEPLLLLHGGFCPVETFDGLTPRLAEAFRVYLPAAVTAARPTPRVPSISCASSW
jgi:hypothetical protein